MRKKIQTVLYLAVLAAAAAGSYTIAERLTDELESKTGGAVRGALSRSEIDWAWVEIDGMQAILRGPAPDEAARFRALAAAGEVLNPLNLRDEMSVAVPVRRPDAAYRLEIMRNGDSILAHGLTPDGGAPDLAALSVAAPELEIVDLVARSSDPAPAGWVAATDLALETVDLLRTVRIILTPSGLQVDGIAPDRETALALETRLGFATPEGMTTEIALQLPRPVLSPFIARFTLDEAGARFDTCAAESDAGRTVILTAAIAAGASEDTTCIPALGAPDPGWSQIIVGGIELISTLGGGTITVSDLSVTISLPPEAMGHPEFGTSVGRFEIALPEIFTLTLIEGEGTDVDGTDASGDIRFTATRSPEGLVNLRGPVGPLEAREIVQTLAQARFGTESLHTALRGGAGLPANWPVQTMAAIDALAKLDAGAVTLTRGLISVRGSTGDPEAEASITRALTKTIGASLAYEVNVTYIEALDPVIVAQGPTPAECVTRINAILEDNDVSFPPGSVEIDAAGLDTVGAIAGVLFECPEAKMEIGGHTDSQGREEMNQLLSQARADAVFNALMERRVLVSNLTSKGYGEEQPIADNDTAEGRETNRRIRFSLIGSDGQVVVTEPGTDEEGESDG